MSTSEIQGSILEVSVVGCNKLKDTEWISRQDPYVFVEYAATKFRTRTCTDGGKNPTFQEKFVFNLIDGLKELIVVVWNSNTLTYDDFIGSGKVHLSKVLSQGYDDSAWPLQTKTGRYAGEVRLILHYSNTKARPTAGVTPSAPPYHTPPTEVPMYPVPSPVYACDYPPVTTYPPYHSYQPNSLPYAPYPPPPHPPAYQQPYGLPPPVYPPPAYPPPPGTNPYYPPPGSYAGIYPPPYGPY